MNKKIIAVFCAVILMASVFSACGKKKLYTYEIAGKQEPVVTDENNALVTNAQGEIAVYVTDENGETLTASNGDPNINYITPPNALVHPNNTLVTENFTFKIPDGWYGDENGSLYKKDTDMKCYIKAIYAMTATTENPFEAYIDAVLVNNRTIIDAINNGSDETKQAGYYSAECSQDEFEFQDYSGQKISYTIYGDKGQVVHYAENLYFMLDDGTVYLMNYVCEDGVGYDSSFNFAEWATNNITFKAPAAKS